MSAAVLLLSLAAEAPWRSLPASPYFSGGAPTTAATLLVIFVGAVIAFCMVWVEYQVSLVESRRKCFFAYKNKPEDRIARSVPEPLNSELHAPFGRVPR